MFPTRKHITIAVIVILSLLILPGSCSVVPPGHRGVLVTLGQVNPDVRGEGFLAKLPWVTTVVKVPIQQIRADGDAACFSSDLQTVHVNFVILYRLPPDKVVTLYQQYQGDPYQSLVEPRVQESIKQVTAEYPAEKLVKSREAIKGEALERVRKAVGGLVEINDLTIANIDLTDQLEKAIEDKMVKEQEAFAKQYELDKAKKDAEIATARAMGEAEAVRITGEALKKSPEMIQLEIVKKWNGVSPQTVVIGADNTSGTVVLPIK